MVIHTRLSFNSAPLPGCVFYKAENEWVARHVVCRVKRVICRFPKELVGCVKGKLQKAWFQNGGSLGVCKEGLGSKRYGWWLAGCWPLY